MAKTKKAITALIENKGGIRLDVGAGRFPEPGFVGMDVRDFPDLDYIQHDFNVFPWPLPDECVIQALARHVVEHIPPHDFGFINWMNELWRVMKPDAQFAAVMPYAGSSGYWQDPTHCNPCNENTFRYFDPLERKKTGLYGIYKPKPWKIVVNKTTDEEEIHFHPSTTLEVLLTKRREDKSYYE
jgi:hypothetical protein